MAGFESKKIRSIAGKIFKWLAVFSLGVFAIMGVIYASLAGTDGIRATEHTFFKQIAAAEPLVIAHRGGAGLAPENTMPAFERAAKLGVDVIELDVRSTSDGTLVVFHDASVNRTTDGAGRVNEMTFDELRRLDAGFRWTPDGGKTFPYREASVRVPTLKEVFTAFPDMKFNIEPKQSAPSIVAPLCALIREHRLVDKTVIGSFSQTIIDEFRRECAGVATSASTTEVGKFLTMYKTGLSESYTPTMHALQIPEYVGFQLLSKEFIKAAHERNLKVHVWTVNETASMQRLLEMGVDGIMTDYPDRLLNLLGRAPAK